MLKHLFATLVIAASSFAGIAQTEINWVTLEEAQELMKTKPKKVVVDVYTKWCGPCRMMMNSTFKDPNVIKYINENYYAVKFNAEGPDPVTFKGTTYTNGSYDPNRSGRNGTHDLTRVIAPVNGRIAYPTLVYMDEEFNILSPVQGFMKATDLEPILKFLATDAYKTESYQEWKAKFKAAWGAGN